jgi:hypothetical protein
VSNELGVLSLGDPSKQLFQRGAHLIFGLANA